MICCISYTIALFDSIILEGYCFQRGVQETMNNREPHTAMWFQNIGMRLAFPFYDTNLFPPTIVSNASIVCFQTFSRKPSFLNSSYPL